MWKKATHQPGHPEGIPDMNKKETCTGFKSKHIFGSICCSLVYPDYNTTKW